MFGSKPKSRQQFRKKIGGGTEDEEPTKSEEATKSSTVAPASTQSNSSPADSNHSATNANKMDVDVNRNKPQAPPNPAPAPASAAASSSIAKKPASAKLSFEDLEGDSGATNLLNRKKTRPQSSAVLLEPTANLAITPAYSSSRGEYTAEKLAALKKNAISIATSDMSTVTDEDLMTREEEAELNRQSGVNAANIKNNGTKDNAIEINDDADDADARGTTKKKGTSKPQDEVDILLMRKLKQQQDKISDTEPAPAAAAEKLLPTEEQIRRARQKRERMRQYPGFESQPEEEGFIPLKGESKPKETDDNPDDEDSEAHGESRLVKDDESDEEDEEEFEEYRGNRISFGPTKKASASASTKKNNDDAGDEEDEEDAEVKQWELEQMMKGGGKKISAAIQKSAAAKENERLKKEAEKTKSPSVPVGLLSGAGNFSKELPSSFPPMLSVDDIERKLQEATRKLSDRHEQHKRERDSALASQNESKSSLSQLEKSRTTMQSQHEFFASTRSYITALCDCLGQKVPVIESTEVELLKLLTQLHEYRKRDRQLDLSDEVADVRELVMNQPPPPAASESEKNDRQIRSQKRLSRRQRQETRRRSTSNANHQTIEGFSSDEENGDENESRSTSEIELIRKKAELLQRLSTLFEDVSEDFSSPSEIKRHFQEWKFRYRHEYVESYTPLSVVQIFSPFVRREMLLWDPLNFPETIQLDSIPLMQELFSYGIDPADPSPAMLDEKDEDLQLAPKLIEKLVVPRVAFLLTNSYNPFSRKHTERAVSLFKQFIEEPLPLLKLLSSAALQSLTEAVTECSVPLFPPTFKSHQIAHNLSSRMFWHTVKLLRNICQWSSLLSVPALQELCYGVLVPHKLLPFLQQLGNASLLPKMVEEILASFPSDWSSNHNPHHQNTVHGLKTLLAERISATDLTADQRRSFVRLILRLGDATLAKKLDEKYKL